MWILFVTILCLGHTLADDDWWKNAVMYQIYPLSFKDSDNDGSGDIKGIISKVDYIKDLGVNAVWMNPIYQSPFRDNGYDTSDFKNINPRFGSLQDVKDMIKAFHDRDIKILLDFVPNHSSDEHQWFKDSIEKKNGKDDFYVWKKPGSFIGSKPVPPNNWVSVFGGSMWTWNEKRQQYYLHQFAPFQPDLNYENEEVVKAMQDVLKFWLDLGVDGFRLDAAPHIAETNYDKDEPLGKDPNCQDKNNWGCYDHIYTKNQDNTYEVMLKFDQVLNEYSKAGSSKAIFVEAYTDVNNTMRFFANRTNPFNFALQSAARDSKADVYVKAIEDWFKNLPKGKPSNWVVGNHDNVRIASKLGEDMAPVMNMILLLLPGTTITYNGEELGMTNAYVPENMRNDTSQSDSRDPQRTPMQWDSSTNAGFSNASMTWLPLNQDYYKINVAMEKEDKNSVLNNYKALAQLHKDMGKAEFKKAVVLDDYAFAYVRGDYAVVVNLDNRISDVNLTNLGLKGKPSIKMTSGRTNKDNANVDWSKSVKMQPRSAMLIKLSSGASTIFASITLIAVCISALLSRH